MIKKTILWFFLYLISIEQIEGQCYTYTSNIENKTDYTVFSEFNLIGIEPEYSGILDQISDSLVIPIKRAGNLLLVETIVDGVSGNLIFDTGAASLLVLNETYFRDHKKIGRKQTEGITGSLQEVGIVKIDSFIISENCYYDLYADVTDLSHIENKKGIKILGFFGLELINDFEIVIDVKNEELKLVRIQSKKSKTNDIIHNYSYSQEIEIVNNVIFLWATVGGRDLKFCMDTGAEENVISYSLPQKVMNSFTFSGRLNLTGAGSSKKEVLYGVMNDFVLGTRPIKNMTALFTDLSGLSEVYGVQISGVLGYQFLTIGKIFVDCKRNLLGIDFN
jgi:hypothetical protein